MVETATPEGWILLHPARKPGRRVYLRKRAVVAVEQDDGQDHSLVRLDGSSYVHIVAETPEEVMALVGDRDR